MTTAPVVGCGVPTGWGSAVNAADVRPGDTVVVYGTGGIGVNVVQGARFAGAQHVVAVDPIPFKRETATVFGATHTAASADEAHKLVQDLTRGVGAHKAVITVDVMHAEVVEQAFDVIGKAGTVVLTSMAGLPDRTISLPGTAATLWKKTVKGSLFGDCNPTTDIPKLLDLYRTGDVRLDELVTRRYTLDEINDGYADLTEGRNIRGLIVHEH